MSQYKLIDTPVEYATTKPRLSFIIRGKIIPYTRMTRRGKFVDSRAGDYIGSQTNIAWQIKAQANGLWFPDQTPLRLKVDFTLPQVHKGDLSNLTKAVEDAAQGVVYQNDCWVDEIIATRSKGDEHKAMVRIEVI